MPFATCRPEPDPGSDPRESRNGHDPLCQDPLCLAKPGPRPTDPLTPKSAKPGLRGGTESEGQPSVQPSRGSGGSSEGGSVPQSPPDPLVVTATRTVECIEHHTHARRRACTCPIAGPRSSVASGRTRIGVGPPRGVARPHDSHTSPQRPGRLPDPIYQVA
jgi:hypothetical protein